MRALLLFTLLSSFRHASSYQLEGRRELGVVHPIENPFKPHEEVVVVYSSKDQKSGKSYKSGSAEMGEDVSYTSKSNKSGKKSDKSGKDAGKDGKTSKSQKKEKYNHKKNDYEVEYQVKVDHSKVGAYATKSSKSEAETQATFTSKSSKKGIPPFEFIDIGHKSYKNSKSTGASEQDLISKYEKSSKYESTTKSSKDGSVKSSKDGNVKNSKSEKYANKYEKSSKSSTPSTPAPAPVGTSHPTMAGSFGVEIPRYSLAYTLVSKGEPAEEEYAALEDATRLYLHDFFVDEFDEDDFTVYEVFILDIANTNSNNKLVIVGYDSEARFDELSTITPTSTQMGSAVAEAFTGLEMIQYEDWLKEMLPSGNIFIGSKAQYYEGDAGVPDTVRRGIGVTGIAASAVAATLLIAGVALYKSKSNDGKDGSDKLDKAPGDMTVAGETFAGETYDGTETVSAVSVDYARRYNDEEDGVTTRILGSIPEDQDVDLSDEDENERTGYGRKMIANALSAFRVGRRSGQRTHSFEDNIMHDPSTSEDDASQMSDSELSQFVANSQQIDNNVRSNDNLEIKSILSMDSMDDNAGLSIRDNSSSRRLRTVAEIEALLSSELENDRGTSTYLTEMEANRPRTVEEIESMLTADDDDSIVELPFSDEEESVVE